MAASFLAFILVLWKGGSGCLYSISSASSDHSPGSRIGLSDINLTALLSMSVGLSPHLPCGILSSCLSMHMDWRPLLGLDQAIRVCRYRVGNLLLPLFEYESEDGMLLPPFVILGLTFCKCFRLSDLACPG